MKLNSLATVVVPMAALLIAIVGCGTIDGEMKTEPVNNSKEVCRGQLAEIAGLFAVEVSSKDTEIDIITNIKVQIDACKKALPAPLSDECIKGLCVVLSESDKAAFLSQQELFREVADKTVLVMPRKE